MTKSEIEAMAEAYADELWNISTDPKDWAWEDSKRDFLAGLQKGFEIAKEMALNIATTSFGFDLADKRAICELRHQLSCRCTPSREELTETKIRSMQLIDDIGDKNE